MYRTRLINFIISHRNYNNYLEIGNYSEQNNFNNVECKYKKGFFVNFKNSTQGTSDNFFVLNQEKFDVIFLDAIHTEEQTQKDIESALKCLTPDGILIIHDCLPPDEWYQREIEEYQEGDAWNGTVWKAVLRIFNISSYKCVVINTDWGCGIIDTANSQSPLSLYIPEELNYSYHFAFLSKYVIGLAEFIKEYVKVFYHLACLGNWSMVFEEQMLLLQKNEFKRINLTVLGTGDDLVRVHSICNNLKLTTDLIFHDLSFTQYEIPTILAIQEYARNNEGYVLYFHSKGVSNQTDQNKAKWRKLMMHELIENWNYCLLKIPYYDVIGVNWCDMPPISHFSGNFWYASTQYLRKLPDFKWYYDNPQYKIWDAYHYKRLTCEFWIGASKEKPSVLSLAYRNVNFCDPAFWNSK